MLYRNEQIPRYLCRVEITGSFYTDDIANGAKSLHLEEKVFFEREENNAYDINAVAVFNDRGIKLGYVSRKENAAVASIMNSGKAEIFGVISYMNVKRSSVGILADLFYVCRAEDEYIVKDIILQYLR